MSAASEITGDNAESAPLLDKARGCNFLSNLLSQWVTSARITMARRIVLEDDLFYDPVTAAH
jgi:hypothetical protein